jgi:hypothetical protein
MINKEQLARLDELQKMLNAGLMTPEEVERERNRILTQSTITPKKSSAPIIIGILGGLLLVALIVLGVIFLMNRKNSAVSVPIPATESSILNTPAVPQQPRVYSCAYDGFVNIHQGPSYSAANIGRFRNGPDGAILLEDLGEWMKIDVNGIIGYVVSRYVQNTPTVAYYGSVDVNWLEGVWKDGAGVLEIFNNGTYRWYLELGGQVGTWILQNNEVKFTLVHEDAGFELGSVFAQTLPIYESSAKLGDFRKYRFYSSSEVDNYRGVGSGAYTKTEFRNAGKAVLKEVERYQRGR